MIKCPECDKALGMFAQTPIGLVAHAVAPESQLWSLYFQRTVYFQCPGCESLYFRTRSAKAVPIEKTYEEMVSGWAYLAAMDCMTMIAGNMVDKGELVPGALEKVWDWMGREQVEALVLQAKEGVISNAQANECATKLLIKHLEQSERRARKIGDGGRGEKNSHRADVMKMRPSKKSKSRLRAAGSDRAGG